MCAVLYCGRKIKIWYAVNAAKPVFQAGLRKKMKTISLRNKKSSSRTLNRKSAKTFEKTMQPEKVLCVTCRVNGPETCKKLRGLEGWENIRVGERSIFSSSEHG